MQIEFEGRVVSTEIVARPGITLPREEDHKSTMQFGFEGQWPHYLAGGTICIVGGFPLGKKFKITVEEVIVPYAEGGSPLEG